MNTMSRAWGTILTIATIILGIGGLMTLEVIESPDMTLGQLLMEMIEPALIVSTAVGLAHLFGRMNRQHREQLTLMRDLETARLEGAHWRADMRGLLSGLSTAIDAQFDRWQLSAAEREIALLMLKGLSHKEIAIVRNTHERTIRQQAQSIYGKANLSGRAALSAFFLEDLLIPHA
jgi:DNA-binding CsgD family transcriptional regulator